MLKSPRLKADDRATSATRARSNECRSMFGVCCCGGKVSAEERDGWVLCLLQALTRFHAECRLETIKEVVQGTKFNKV